MGRTALLRGDRAQPGEGGRQGDYLRGLPAIFLTLNAIRLLLLDDRPIANVSGNLPLSLFYFSIETLATVGYGDMHPQTGYGHLVAAVEIFTGMCLLAVMTGLAFCPPFAAEGPLCVRPASGGKYVERPTDADDPNRQCAAQHDIAGDRASVAVSPGAHQGTQATSFFHHEHSMSR